MNPNALLRRFDAFQQRNRVLALPLAVQKKFGDDDAGSQAALIAYFGFFSIFPLLLVFTTVLGFVLEGDPSAREKILNSTLNQVPVIGEQLGKGQLTGSGLGLAIGAVLALLSGLGVTVACQKAFDRVYGVSYPQRAGFVGARLRGLAVLAIAGTLQVVSTVGAGLITGGLGGPLLFLGGIAVSFAVNLVLFSVVFRMLTSPSVPTDELKPGIVVASVAWAVLQAVGGVYIGHVIDSAGNTYGTFATVIGLLTWLFLGGRVVVYSAELNSVLARGLWPRAMFPDGDLLDQGTPGPPMVPGPPATTGPSGAPDQDDLDQTPDKPREL